MINITAAGPTGAGLSTGTTSNGVDAVTATASSNAALVVSAINGNTNNVVTATDLGGGQYRLDQKTVGVSNVIQVTSSGGAATGLTNITTANGTTVTAADNAQTLVSAINANTNNVVTAATTGGGGYTLTQKTASSADKIVITSTGGTASGLSVGTTANGTDGSSDNNNINTGTGNSPANLQVGAGANDSFTVAFARVDVSAQGLKALDTALNSFRDNHSVANAQALISAVDTSISAVNQQRSNLGGRQNRLEHTIANLGVAHENLAASESRIRDADMAAEMVSFTRGQILQQAGTAILAQANQQPQSVLSLLR